VELLDAAIAKRPREPELLMAKASALCRMMQMKSGEDVVDQVLAIDPQHLDAKMRKDVWDDWPLLFEFPAWDPKGKSAVPLFQTELGEVGPAETKLVLARVGLRLEPVAVQSTDGVTFRNGIRADMRGMVQVKLAETPHGPVAAWYVLLEDDVTKPFVREAFLPASGGEPHPLKGPWLLQRLADCGFCHLVFTAGERVLYHRRVELPAEQLQALRRARDHSADKRTPFDLDRFQSAVKWYTDRSDFAQIRFPASDAGATAEIDDQNQKRRSESVKSGGRRRRGRIRNQKQKSRVESVKEAASTAKTSCPSCGFSYGWDGSQCRHCGQGQLQEDKHSTRKRKQKERRDPEPGEARCPRCGKNSYLLHSDGRCPYCPYKDTAQPHAPADDGGVMFIGVVKGEPDMFDWLFEDPELPLWAIGTILVALLIAGLGVTGWFAWQGANLFEAVVRFFMAFFGLVIVGGILLWAIGGFIWILVKLLRLPANLVGVVTLGAIVFGVWKAIETF
ncbi:MAG TPA: Yip1 family protein, partial [Rhodothermales bacterium]|nr:Yip1 family protein [Rhodothermales bacterium]